VQIQRDGDVWIDEPLADYMGRLGIYERVIEVIGNESLRIRIYNGNYGELRIRIGRWKGDND